MPLSTDVTCAIKTLLRPRQLMTLVRSIRRFHPTLAIVVGDDAEEPLEAGFLARLRKLDVRYHKLPVDTGVSKGRNILLDMVETKYAVVCDDDLIFYKWTDLHFMRDVLESTEVELLGTGYLHWTGKKWRILEWSGRFLRFSDEIRIEPVEPETPWRKCDITHQFFMVDVEAFRRKNAYWDPELKTGEHVDFFLGARERGLVVAHTPNAIVLHVRGEAPERYNELRTRGRDYYVHFMRKRGIRRLVEPDGTSHELGDSGELRQIAAPRRRQETPSAYPPGMLPLWQPTRGGRGRRPRRRLLRDAFNR